MFWFVSQSRSDSQRNDGWDKGAGVEVKETARGGGKMCSDESKEWHEKEAKREKGKDAAVNGGAALKRQR